MTMKNFLRHPLSSMDSWWEKASPKRRIDMNLGNMFMLAGLMFPSLSIIFTGPVPNSRLAEMSEHLQVAMCICIFVGCGMKLHGALAGRKYWFPNTAMKRSYTYGFSGAPIAFVGCVTYGYYILHDTPNFWSALSGIATPMFGLGILLQGCLYVLEYRRIDRNETKLREVEQTRLNDEQ